MREKKKEGKKGGVEMTGGNREGRVEKGKEKGV